MQGTKGQYVSIVSMHLTIVKYNLYFHPFPWQRVLSHQDDTALLKAYIVEWRKFFTQCDILPKPFCQLEITLMGKQGSNKKTNMEDSIVRKVRGGGGKNPAARESKS